MAGQFVVRNEVEPEVLDWGQLRWLSNPPVTGARDLTVINVTLAPGKGHNFTTTPIQEEVILRGCRRVEQWVDRDKRISGRATPPSCPPAQSMPRSTSAARRRTSCHSGPLCRRKRL
jgi:hypothetical protein